ncbi:MAG: hypothetical protein R3B54_00330 [Bdellovibrionota bacterium]
MNPLSEEEQAAMEKNKHWQGIVADAYSRIREGAKDLPPGVEPLDLSQLFQGHNETLYADIMHYLKPAISKSRKRSRAASRLQLRPLL